jgi:hypothetical protein
MSAGKVDENDFKEWADRNLVGQPPFLYYRENIRLVLYHVLLY